MDLKLIKNLLNMISESDLNEVSIEEGELKIKVKKRSDVKVAPQEQVYYAPPQQSAAPAPSAPASQPAADSGSGAAKEASSGSGQNIKSPIVGTFYASPSPEDPPFVKAGDKVKKGDVLCIIEAMKIMNEIESDVSGTIVKVLVSDAQPVEFDQPLFVIEPN
jgi:acetyl-CoA carboxylase biotin carboxyl carrier protein